MTEETIKVDIFILGHLTDVIQGLKKENYGYEIQKGFTVREMAGELGIKQELLYMVLVNRRREDLNYILKDGDQVSIFSPPAGG